MNKININKKYRTRDGRKVVILSTEAPEEDWPVIISLEYDPGNWVNWATQIDGRSASSANLDLIEVREPRVVYINEYNDGLSIMLHDSALEAHTAAGHAAIRKAVKFVEVIEDL